jgi:hypothetical protein
MGGLATHRAGCFNPAPSGGGLGYMTYESLSEVTESSGTYVDVLSATIPAGDQKANTDYLGIWTCEGSNTASVLDGFYVNLEKNGSALQELNIAVKETSPQDYVSCGGLFRHQSGSSPSSTTYASRVKRNSAGTGASKKARITLLELGPEDHYAESIALQTYSTDTSYQTAATLSFTVTGTADYVVLFSLAIGNSNNAITSRFRVGDGTTTYGPYGKRPTVGSRDKPVMGVLHLPGISGSKTITVEYMTQTAGVNSARIRNIVMCAIRLDRFDNTYLANLSADDTGTNTSMTTALTQTFTPVAADHLSLAAWGMEGSSTTISALSRYDDGGTVIGDCVMEPGLTTNDDDFTGGFTHQLKAYAASSRTQKIERQSEASATTRIKNKAAILTIDLTGI